MIGADNRSQLMKRNSRSLILYCVSRCAKASRGQIVELTGLSRAHAYDVVDELIAEGELIETESVSIGRGRPTVFLKINPNCASAAGVWLAEDSIEIGLANATGETIARESLTYSSNPIDDIDAAASAIQKCAEHAGKSMRSVRGIGIVAAGLVDPSMGVIFHTTHDTGFGGIPIVKLFHDRTGLPVFADTDIRAAALADQWYKVEYERVLYVSFCDGIGAAYVTGRELFGNAHGEAPGVAHLIIDRNGPLCECGKRGCLQTYTSNHTFINKLWPNVDVNRLSTQERREMVRRGVDMATAGDFDAIAAVSGIAEYMGFGIANVVNMLDPQVVYVAGTLIDYIPDIVMSMIRRNAMPYINEVFYGVEIKPLPTLHEFEMKGAFGLVLFSQFRSLSQDINTRFLALNISS